MAVTAAALLADLCGRGVAVEARGGWLRLVPGDRVSDADRVALQASKPDVLMLLGELASLTADGTAALWRTLYEALTDAERERLAAEVAKGDSLAVEVWLVVARLAP
jgi:hypothetical protein